MEYIDTKRLFDWSKAREYRLSLRVPEDILYDESSSKESQIKPVTDLEEQVSDKIDNKPELTPLLFVPLSSASKSGTADSSVSSGLSSADVAKVDFSKLDSRTKGNGYKLTTKSLGVCTSGPGTWLKLMGYDVHGAGRGGWWTTPYSEKTITANFIKNDPTHWKLVYNSDASGANSFKGMQPGDIALAFGRKSNGSPTSHAQMWTGSEWRSDFILKNAWVYSHDKTGRNGNMSFLVWRYVKDGVEKMQEGGLIDVEDYFNWSNHYPRYTFKSLQELTAAENALNNRAQTNTASIEASKKAEPLKKSSKEEWRTPLLFTPIGTALSLPATISELTLSGSNADRDRIISKLKNLGLDNDTAVALAAHAGGESSYKMTAEASSTHAYGLGQWMPSNHKAVLDYINKTYKKGYNSMKQLSEDEQVAALKWWYYDRHKSLVDGQKGAYKKAMVFDKIGLSPAIATTGKYKNYTDTEEGWTRWITDTKNNPKKLGFTAHFLDRLKRAGFSF